MYIPSHFRMSDPEEITSFIHDHSFGILVNDVDHQPFATHLPFLYDAEENVLFAHLAKANPQWRSLDGQTVMVIFSGPHAYISPSWYEVPASVPTWNYVVVHVYGKCTIVDNDEELADLLRRTLQFYEPDSDLASQAAEPFFQNLMKAIVGIRIEITDVQGAAKLSQNKSTDVQQRVIANLLRSGDIGSKAVAERMQTRLGDTEGVDGNADS